MSSTHHINLCVQSNGSEDDWKNLYEASFPQDERMSVSDVRTLLANGTMLLHKTTDAQGGLQCFSLVTVLSNNVLLAYIATDQTKRSSGVGSKHMKALIDLLKKLYPSYIGLFLEIESTKEKNLPADEDKARKRRLAFYQRLHCRRMLGKEYLLPSYSPGTTARQGELLWSEFNGPINDDATLKSVISEIYTKAYGLSTTDPQYVRVVGQFTANGTTATSPAVSAAPANASISTSSTAPAAPVADVSTPASANQASTTAATTGDATATSAQAPVTPVVTPASPASQPQPASTPDKAPDSGTKS